ncbi:hypothetical protein FACS189413_18410 [Bacteroidia bacterium]|nr:hypothetical protein FACS189413_18410 [Bacteroidia bacterium]
MRTIKFRGKTANGEWVTGNLIINSNMGVYKCGITNNGMMPIYSTYKKVDVETVGQFTGLLDINGKEIYEGDILEYKLEDKHRIAFIEYSNIIGRFLGRTKEYQNVLNSTYWNKSKVIGNIHDNPELLDELIKILYKKSTLISMKRDLEDGFCEFCNGTGEVTCSEIHECEDTECDLVGGCFNLKCKFCQ